MSVPLADEGDDVPTITPYRDGPLILRGSFRIEDQDGNEIDPGRETVALCRCGKSGLKPFCDGAHRRAGFRAASGPSRERHVAALRRADLDGPSDDA
ncbi:CDGSH-type Zn-finger protein [Motilibacter rhizosphaerae]|uniref:CDGSH-type Zn-finger protein n=1 Tax=Motilibacter rhizosphaerae TaxID=598652 RepID=A0A4Q7NAY0_9ACTN|nr:CDGSH iron-sulfur domain-containing protein [Motilibacter rhizosphaerae]RZS80003.1 CDGSH-type Zn-finger protein [Motilibacter rhizosphaerae]